MAIGFLGRRSIFRSARAKQADSADAAQASGGGTQGPPTDGVAGGGTAPPPDPPPAPPPAPPSPPASMLSQMTQLMVTKAADQPPDASELNQKIVQAVRVTNAETTGYAPSQIAIGPNMMIAQASGLVAQSAAAYFDGVSKLTLASQAVLLKQMTEDLVAENIKGAAEQAVGLLVTDVLLGVASAVAAAAGAMEADAAGFAIDKIDQSIEKYADLFQKSKSH